MACSTAAVGDGTHAVLAPDSGCPILVSTISRISSGIVHIPFPICPRPLKPVSTPTSTFQSSYAASQGCARMSAFGCIGPASMLVWISSPVRSRKPVLMNTTRSLASRIAAFRFTVVRRSSSMMPILIVLRSRPSAASTRSNRLIVAATSSGPCSFGFTM